MISDDVISKFVDPRPLYKTHVPLGTRVGVFERYLAVDMASRSLFRDVTRTIARYSPILDIGCGVGAPLLPVGPTVMERHDMIGGDLSLRQLQSIRQNTLDMTSNTSSDTPSDTYMKLLQFDAAHLPFRDESFGAAVARHMLYHVPDPRLAAAESARVIRDDGLFIATTNSSNSRPELQNAHRQAITDLGGRFVERISTVFDAETGQDKLTGSFRQVHTKLWSGVLNFPTVTEVLDYYRSTAYFKMAFDTTDDREQLARRVTEILRSRFKDGPAPLTVGGAIFICTDPIRENEILGV